MQLSSKQTAPRAQPQDLAGGALRTFFNIVRAWGLGDEQAMRLLGVPRTTYYRWKQRPGSARLSQDTLERLSYVFGIYKALHILLPDEAAADTWLRRPNDNPLFAGRPPVERLLAGQVADLYVVRQYLDAQRGWA